MSIVRDRRQVDLEDYLRDIPDFLLAELRPADLQARTDARIRAFRERQAAEEAGVPARRQVPRRLPRSFTE